MSKIQNEKNYYLQESGVEVRGRADSRGSKGWGAMLGTAQPTVPEALTTLHYVP